MKTGGIVKNPWAGIKNPLRISIYIGNYTCLYWSLNQFHKAKYDKEIFERFEVIGQSKGYEIIKEELIKLNIKED